ncbi:hypothetical protein Leryth_017575 [Lithospermum erythrorhizon]|nr:hypothetical protein Leryth_017575 [Lithospermum erythrorhizon]
MGDFNCSCKPSEKCGRKKLTTYELKYLGEFMMKGGLEDAPSTGFHFTWNKGSLWTKLDQVLNNQAWHMMGSSCLAIFLPMEPFSDHCPVVVSVLQKGEGGCRPFKFFNMWLKHPDLKEIVTKSWEMVVTGSDRYVLCFKLKALKRLKQGEYGGISAKATKSNADFKEAMDQSLIKLGNDFLKEQVTLLRKKNTFEKAEISFFRQRAKCTHLVEADKGISWLKVKTKSPGFKYHPKCRSNRITHTAFADDLMLYSRGDISSVSFVMECLKNLEECLGLMVSPTKSNIFLARVRGIVWERILEGIRFEEGVFPVRYLGIPLVPMKVSVVEFSPFLEAIGNYLQKWKPESFHLCGKVELIRITLSEELKLFGCIFSHAHDRSK